MHLFGSTANCLAITHNNDIDVCLELPALEDDQVRANAPRTAHHVAGVLQRQRCRHAGYAAYEGGVKYPYKSCYSPWACLDTP